MKRPEAGCGVDLRTFHWRLAPLERRLDNAVESARLALGQLQAQARLLGDDARRRAVHQAQQERLARACVQRDPRAGADAVMYLAALEAARVASDTARAEMDQHIAGARSACADTQRQLECVQALRLSAQRVHAQAQMRREWKEADAAWVALVQRRCSARRGVPEGTT
jgi:hypothetical protein